VWWGNDGGSDNAEISGKLSADASASMYIHRVFSSPAPDVKKWNHQLSPEKEELARPPTGHIAIQGSNPAVAIVRDW
jgi:hypothetical protein